jgi:non-heme chloroperoxidase
MDRRNVLRSVLSAGAGAAWWTGRSAAAGEDTAAASRAVRAGAPYFEARDGTRLFYQDWGTGRPVVFIHGWAIGAGMWEYQMTPLAGRGLRCIAYDRRGCGRSAQPGHGYDFDTFADDLAALLSHLDLREVTLIGHSMGAGEVARYLSRHGTHRVARAALVAATLPFALKTPDNPDGADGQVFDHMVAELAKDRPRYLAASTASFFGVGRPGISVSTEMMEWGVRLALQASPLATIAMVRAMSETDFRPDIRAFTVPTLIVHGDADDSAPLDFTARKLARLIRGSRLEVYAGAPHGLFITHRERFNADLGAFVGG